ncbi:MAG TPA: hypothetical protein VN922_21665 [Bacteroidia bacterium]|nr:hypothetical protein [Bacteroidia bacterium]
MNNKEVFHILNEQFLLGLIEVIDFNVKKDRASLIVLNVENSTLYQNYQIDFSEVIAFDFWKAQLDLTNDELEVDVDDKKIKPLSEVTKYKNMTHHSDLIKKVSNPNEYWCLDFTCAGFCLSIVFKDVSVKKI